MEKPADWVSELPAAVTVTSADGTIVEMNRSSQETFQSQGGAGLIGGSVFDCHEGAALEKTLELYRRREANHYTIEKNGRRKMIHQLPWYRDGRFAGFVEISVPIPAELAHFNRDR